MAMRTETNYVGAGFPASIKVYRPETCYPKLRIPSSFLKYFNGDIPVVSLLEVEGPTRRAWRVGIQADAPLADQVPDGSINSGVSVALFEVVLKKSNFSKVLLNIPASFGYKYMKSGQKFEKTATLQTDGLFSFHRGEDLESSTMPSILDILHSVVIEEIGRSCRNFAELKKMKVESLVWITVKKKQLKEIGTSLMAISFPIFDACFTNVTEDASFCSEKLQKLGWQYRPLEETLTDAVESYKQGRWLSGFKKRRHLKFTFFPYCNTLWLIIVALYVFQVHSLAN
ncbi:hypothetical protein P3S68_012991 [Capsicum galapagoense]